MFLCANAKKWDKYISFYIFSICILVCSYTDIVYGKEIGDEPAMYLSAHQHTLLAPSVARVVNHTEGKLNVSAFTIDIDKLKALPHPEIHDTYTEEVDTTMTGSAFSISDDGLYITNAHVATSDLYRMTVATELMISILIDDYTKLAYRYGPQSQQVQNFEEKLNSITGMDKNDPALQSFREEVLSFVEFKIGKKRVAVIPQLTTVSSIKEITEVGYEVESIETFPNWVISGKDIALLKVSEKNYTLPAAMLAVATSTTSINDEITVYGYPGSTDIGLSSFADLTVTKGRITSIKKTDETSFDNIQIDAKISKGSSGGPLVDISGKVIGVITYETGTESGDNFGFAIPVELVYELLEEKKPQIVTEYSQAVRKGLAFKEQFRCKKAIEQFEKSMIGNILWNTAKDETDKLIKECNELIASGDSIDNVFDEFVEYVKTKGVIIWALLILGGVLLLLGIFILIFVLRTRKKVVDTSVTPMPRNMQQSDLQNNNLGTVPESPAQEGVIDEFQQDLQEKQSAFVDTNNESDNEETGGWYINNKPVNKTKGRGIDE